MIFSNFYYWQILIRPTVTEIAPSHRTSAVILLHAVYRTIIAPTETLKTSFSATVELFLIEGSRLFIIFDFQQLLLLTNFDQTQGYGDRIEAMFLEYFFIDRLIARSHLVTLCARIRLPKNRFRNIPTRNRATCASGSGLGSGSPLPSPPPSAT